MIRTFGLDTMPDGLHLKSVAATIAHAAGRVATRLTLTEDASNGTPGVDYVDMPTFAVFPGTFRNGRISVDILGRVRTDAPDFARGFAGIAYRIEPTGQTFESVYLRPLNGRRLSPPPPRDKRAIQYFAYPDWKFDRLRSEEPDGPYEAGLDIADNEWLTLAIEVDDMRLLATVNGAEALSIPRTKGSAVDGSVGLWVDIGTEAYFSNLTINARD